MRAVAADVRGDAAASRPCSRPRAAASSAASTRATATCASHPTRRAIRRSRGSSPGCSTSTRWPRSAATTRSATSCRSLRATFRKYPRSAHLRAQRPVVQSGRRPRGHRLQHPRARPEGAGEGERGAAHPHARDGRHRGRRHHAQARQARAARHDRPRPRGRSGRGRRGHRDGDATHGRRRRQGVALRRSDGERGLRRPGAAARKATATTPARSRGSTCRAQGGGLVRLDSLARLEPALHGVAHRPSRSPARGEHPRQRSRPATPWAIASKRCARPHATSTCRLATRPTSRAAAASWSARSASSSGRSCCRSRSCT